MTSYGGLDRARAAVELRRWSMGVELCAHHLSEHPADAAALALLAQCQLALDDPRGALAAAKAAAALDPDDEWSHRLMSQAHGALGHRRKAAGSAREAVRLAPDQWQPRAALASALSATRRHRKARAQAGLAVVLAPDNPAAHVAAGDAALAASKLRRAALAYRHALALDPSDSAALNQLGLVELRRGRARIALERFVGSVQSDPAQRAAPYNAVLAGGRVLVQVLMLNLVWMACLVALAAASDWRAGPSPLGDALSLIGAWSWWRAALLTQRRLPPHIARILRRQFTRTPASWVSLSAVVGDLVLLAALPWAAWERLVSIVYVTGLATIVSCYVIRNAQYNLAVREGLCRKSFSWFRR